MSNLKENTENIRKFRKELEALFEDITEIDVKVLKKTLAAGDRAAKNETPVGDYPSQVEFTTKDGKRVSFKVTKKVGGHLRRNWFVTNIERTPYGISGTLYNNVEYAIPVNNGHRIKSKDGQTLGFVKGKFMLQKAIIAAEKTMAEEFKKSIGEVKSKHDS